MNFDDYFKEYTQDSNIDSSSLDKESMKIPVLHSKYLQYLSRERIKLKKFIERKKSLESKLEDYYSGGLDGKDIGRPPFQQVLTKSSIQKKIDSDKEMIDCNLIISTQEEIVTFLSEVVKTIGQRNFTIKNTIDWLKWTQGQ